MPALVPGASAALAAVVLAALAAGCRGPAAPPPPPHGPAIRASVEAIRRAILAKDADGVVAPGTADWSFTGADGTRRDRATWLADTRAALARVPRVVSLDTTIESMTPRDDGAVTVVLAQFLVRETGNPPPEAPIAWSRYREEQEWVLDSGAWRVRSVRVLGQPDRGVAPSVEAVPR